MANLHTYWCDDSTLQLSSEYLWKLNTSRQSNDSSSQSLAAGGFCVITHHSLETHMICIRFLLHLLLPIHYLISDSSRQLLTAEQQQWILHFTIRWGQLRIVFRVTCHIDIISRSCTILYKVVNSTEMEAVVELYKSCTCCITPWLHSPYCVHTQQSTLKLD